MAFEDLSSEELLRQKTIAEIEKLNAERDKSISETRIFERNNRNLDALYTQSRVYTFYEEVNSISCYKAIEEISQWARRDPQQSIEIVLTSPGGNVLHGLALYDFLMNLRREGTPINVTVVGFAASMAGVLLQAGEERVMGANSWLLIHEVSDVMFGNLSMIEDKMEFTSKLQDNLLNILSSRSNISKSAIKRKWKKKDWWMPAKDALEHGFIDRIV